MPMFRDRRQCQYCGNQVKQPKDPDSYLCPSCQNPGPWARPEHIEAWYVRRADEARKAAEQRPAEER